LASYNIIFDQNGEILKIKEKKWRIFGANSPKQDCQALAASQRNLAFGAKRAGNRHFVPGTGCLATALGIWR
jgi:hypothetical protein